jgi:acetyl esterase/lipase
MRVFKDIAYRQNSRCPEHLLDITAPDERGGDMIIFFHGGGMQSGSKDDLTFLYGLTEDGYTLAFPNYRLYPGAVWPQFVEDAAAAVAWVMEHRADYCGRTFQPRPDAGPSPGRTYIAGSSAGAYLAMMLCFDKRWLGAYGLLPETFNGFIFDAGQPTVHFNVLHEFGIPMQSVLVDERAPMFYPREGENYPPMLFLCADNDMPGRYEQTLLMLSVLKNFGHAEKTSFRYMKGYGHCAYNNEPVFLDIIKDFIVTGQR